MTTCTERLAEAQQALHDLVTGQSVVRIAFEGNVTEYQPSDVAKLRAYIGDLVAECGDGDAATRRRLPGLFVY